MARNWITNNEPGSPRNGQKYYIENRPDSRGNPGEWHIYKDGTKVFVAAPVEIQAPPNWGVQAPIAAAPAPAPPPPPEVQAPKNWGVNVDVPGPAKGVDRPANPPAPDFSNVPWGQPGQGPVAQGPAKGVDRSGDTGSSLPPNQESAAVRIGQPYVVRAGDTLSGIAARNNMSLQQVLSLNPQFKNNPDLILPGQQVNLGGGMTAAGDFPANSTYPPVANPTGGAQAPKKLSAGWDSGTGGVPANPEHGIVAVDTSQDTNPLRIDHSNEA